MTAGPTIRPPMPHDAAALGRVHVAAWRDAYAGILPAPYLVNLSADREARRWSALLARRDRRSPILVAADRDGRAVGFGMAGRQRSDLADIDAEVYALYVAPLAQGGGYGRALMASLADALLRLGHDSACVWVLRDNPARWFYQALGGRLAAESPIRHAGVELVQLAYAWPDRDALEGLAAPVRDRLSPKP